MSLSMCLRIYYVCTLPTLMDRKMSDFVHEGDMRHGIMWANVHAWTSTPPPLQERNHMLHNAGSLHFSGHSRSPAMAVAVGNAMRIQPSVYSYDGAVMTQQGVMNLGIAPAGSYNTGLSQTHPWVDMSMDDAGFRLMPGPVGDECPHAQLLGGYVMTEITILEDSEATIVAIGQNEVEGVGITNGLMGPRAMPADAFPDADRDGGRHEQWADIPFFEVDAASTIGMASSYGAFGSLQTYKDPMVITTGHNETKTVFAYVPVIPNSTEYAHMHTRQIGQGGGSFVHFVGSQRLSGALAGTPSIDTTINGPSNDAVVNNITGNTQTLGSISEIRIRERIGVDNSRATMKAGYGVIEVTNVRGTAVVTATGVMHYEVRVPTQRVPRDTSAQGTSLTVNMVEQGRGRDGRDLAIPHRFTYLPLIRDVASHGAIADTPLEVVSMARRLAYEATKDERVRQAITAIPILPPTTPKYDISRALNSHYDLSLRGMVSKVIAALTYTESVKRRRT